MSEHRWSVSISSPPGENHLPETVTVADSLSSAPNEPFGKLACCCLFFIDRFFVIRFVLVGLVFKVYLPARLRSFFATAELRLFSTILSGRTVDLFFNSGTAAGGIPAVRQPESGDVARPKFLQSWRECGFRAAPLHAAHGGTMAVDLAACGGRRAGHRFRISFGS